MCISEIFKLPIYLADTDTAPKVAKPRKEKKEPNRIDFLTPSDPGKSWKIIADELFAPPSKGASINLPGTSAAAKKRKAKDEKKRDNHCLPDDMHFSSRQLVTLFLKPKFSVRGFWHSRKRLNLILYSLRCVDNEHRLPRMRKAK